MAPEVPHQRHLERAREIPVAEYERQQPPRITIITDLPSVWDMPDRIEWLIEGVLPTASVNLLASESGIGKTWVAYAIAGAVANGTAFAGQGVRKRPVLYVDGENPLAVVKDRLVRLGIQQTPDLRIWGGWVAEDPPPGPKHDLIAGFAQDTKGLIIYDSLVEFHTGDEQHATETREFMRLFRKLANLGATVLILHHTGKSKTSLQYRGSTDIKAAVDTAYVMERSPKEDPTLHKVALFNFKSRFAEGRDLWMEFRPDQGFVAAAKATGARDNLTETLTAILTTHPMNATAFKKLAQEAGVRRKAASEFLKGLDLPPVLGQTVKTQIPLNGELSHGIVS